MVEARYVDDGDNAVLKSALYDAWKGECWWCRRPIEYRDAQIDHLLPKTASDERFAELTAELGLDDSFDVHDPRNLAPICVPCNQEKSNTDYTKTERILSRLHKAETLRPKVIRLVKSFGDGASVASALLRAKEADLHGSDARQALLDHGPGFVQAHANIAGFAVEYTDHRSVSASSSHGQPVAEVIVALDSGGRRTVAVLEDVCLADLDAILTETAIAMEAELGDWVVTAFEGTEVPGGGTYAGPPVTNWFDVDVSSINLTRDRADFRFDFGGTFQVQISSMLVQDDKEPGTLEEVQGEAFLEGEFSFDVWWSAIDDDNAVVNDFVIGLTTESTWTE